MRFLDVTLDTYQNTSGYMYLGQALPGPRAHHWLLLPGGLLALPDREAGEEEDEKEEADDADDADEQPPAKKKKGDKRAEAPAEAAEASKAPKAAAKAAKAAAMAPKESPRRASTRGRK